MGVVRHKKRAYLKRRLTTTIIRDLFPTLESPIIK
jgi:hypothetical protein